MTCSECIKTVTTQDRDKAPLSLRDETIRHIRTCERCKRTLVNAVAFFVSSGLVTGEKKEDAITILRAYAAEQARRN